MEKNISALMKDLEGLNNEYLDLERQIDHSHSTIEESGRYEELLTQSGNLIRDFYNDVFVPKYSQNSGEVFEYVKGSLKSWSDMISHFISQGNNFGLGKLLDAKGSKIGDPNELTSLIEEVKRMSEND